MKKKILVVDDSPINREILSEILCEYNVLTAENGLRTVDLIESNQNELALVLLDLFMPIMDGFAVLDYMKEKGFLKRIPVVVITGDDSVQSEKRCYSYGIVEFIRKPFDATLINMRISNVIDLYTYRNSLEDQVAEQTQKIQKQYTRLKSQAHKLAESNQKVIDLLGSVVESRNLESGLHIQRVKNYTEIIARRISTDYPEYGLSNFSIKVMVLASALHDVGKIAIPDSILLKKGRLTSDEFEIMKTHTTRGCSMLDSIKDAWAANYARVSYRICRHHHERYDGKGYPDGLMGDEIPIEAQIVSVADVYDALIHERVYKEAYSKEQAYKMIINGECGVFSPKILDCFVKSRALLESVTD